MTSLQSDITIYLTLTSTSTSTTRNAISFSTRLKTELVPITLANTASGASVSASTPTVSDPESTVFSETAVASNSGSMTWSSSSSSSLSSSSATAARITDMDINQQRSSTSISNSTKLGLALGVPLGITFVFALIVIVWYYMRKKPPAGPVSTPCDAPQPSSTYPDSSNVSSIYSNYGALEKGPKHKPIPLQLDENSKNLTSPTRPITQSTPAPAPAPTPTLRTFLKSRFSMYNKSQEYVISPLFLRKFKLHPTTACKPYLKSRTDELDLAVGDKLVLVKEFLDGWCRVRKDGVEGVVPKACLRR